MTRESISARMAGQMMAVDPILGRPLLAMDWPSVTDQANAAAADMVAGADVKVDRGQRFVTVRGVAVLPVRGLLTPNSEMLERYLGWATYAGIEAAVGEIMADDAVGAVVLELDSPGGMVMGLASAVVAVAALAAAKPVYALACPLAASAAYAIASQATELTMAPGAYVGSIGVMRESAVPVQPDGQGLQWDVHLSSHARAKWADARTEAGRAEIARALDESEAVFHADVARGRKMAIEDLPARLSVTDDPRDGGAVFGPAEAMRRGLADRAETRAAFYARIFAAHAPAPSRGAARGYRAQGAVAAARAAAALAQT